MTTLREAKPIARRATQLSRLLALLYVSTIATFSLSANELGYTCTENEPACVQNYNKNLKASHGQKRVAVAPINFSDTSWNPSKSKINSTMNRVNQFYKDTSRGKYGFSDISIRSTTQVDLPQSCGNRSKANRSVSGVRSYDMRIFSFPAGTCGFGGNAGGGTVNMNTGNIGNTMTMRHEIGHILRLTHSRDYERRNCKNEKSFCYDKTTLMGAQNTKTYNAPELHWLGWFEKQEVERIQPNKLEYQLRAINKNAKTGDTPLALVYDIPHTGNRLFLTMPKSAEKLKAGEERLNSHDLVIYIASPCRRCTFQKSVLFERFNGYFEDETGLTIEVVDAPDLSNVTLRIHHSEQQARCTQPISFNATTELKRAIGRKKGKLKLLVEAENANPEGCRPVTLVDSNSVALWSSTDARKLGNRADGVGIKETRKVGAGYIFTESDSQANRKVKPRSIWEYEITSTSLERMLAKIKIGNLPTLEIPVSFAEGESGPVDFNQSNDDAHDESSNDTTDENGDGNEIIEDETTVSLTEMSLTTGKIALDHSATQLPLPSSASYHDAVVLAGVPSYAGKDPVVAEAVSDNGKYFLRLNEWQYLDRRHKTETIPYLVAEAGVYQHESLQLEYGNIQVNSVTDVMPFAFQQSFQEAPTILFTIRNNSNVMPVAVRLAEVSRDGFKIRAMLEEKLQRKVDEIQGVEVGYMAVSGAAGRGDNILELPLVTASDSVQFNYQHVKIDDSPKRFPVFIQEERSRDKETRHTWETLGLVMFDDLIFGSLQSLRGDNPMSLRLYDH